MGNGGDGGGGEEGGGGVQGGGSRGDGGNGGGGVGGGGDGGGEDGGGGVGGGGNGGSSDGGGIRFLLLRLEADFLRGRRSARLCLLRRPHSRPRRDGRKGLKSFATTRRPITKMETRPTKISRKSAATRRRGSNDAPCTIVSPSVVSWIWIAAICEGMA